MKSSFIAKCFVSSISLLVGTLSLQAVITIQFVADNDFAVFTGNAAGVTRLVYQNDVRWDDQIAAAAEFSFEVEPGEDMFYVLAMGADGNENISGKINGVNIVSIRDVVDQSSNFVGSLSDHTNASVSNGSYIAKLEDVQAVFSTLTWAAPVLNNQYVVTQNPHAFDDTLNGNYGFTVPDHGAVLFRFDAESVGVVVPEPAIVSFLMAVGALGRIVFHRRRR